MVFSSHEQLAFTPVRLKRKIPVKLLKTMSNLKTTSWCVHCNTPLVTCANCQGKGTKDGETPCKVCKGSGKLSPESCGPNHGN